MLMGALSDADRVWNRATQWDRPTPTEPGDRALKAVLRVDGQIMNGGLESALEYIEPEEVAAAADGFAFFGRNDLADLLRSALGTFPDGAPPRDQDAREDALMALGDAARERLDDLDSEYNNTATSELLTEIFEAHYHAHPEDFAELEPS
jgi:hypothetical protein